MIGKSSSDTGQVEACGGEGGGYACAMGTHFGRQQAVWAHVHTHTPLLHTLAPPDMPPAAHTG